MADTTDKQVLLVIEILGTKDVNVIDKSANNAAEKVKQIVLHEGELYQNYGWSIIKAIATKP